VKAADKIRLLFDNMRREPVAAQIVLLLRKLESFLICEPSDKESKINR
jgi:hypothetical protein